MGAGADLGNESREFLDPPLATQLVLVIPLSLNLREFSNLTHTCLVTHLQSGKLGLAFGLVRSCRQRLQRGLTSSTLEAHSNQVNRGQKPRVPLSLRRSFLHCLYDNPVKIILAQSDESGPARERREFRRGRGKANSERHRLAQ